jgi:hypothetical protein
LKGKTTWTKPDPVARDIVKVPVELLKLHKEVYITADLFFVNKIQFFLTSLELQDDKICMMTTRLACNRAIESSYWRMDNNSDVGLLMGNVLY